MALQSNFEPLRDSCDIGVSREIQSGTHSIDIIFVKKTQQFIARCSTKES